MSKPTFNELNLHDSRVLQLRLSLDLREAESLEVFLRYIDDYDAAKSSIKRLTFTDCREVRIEGHLGHIRGNSILRGESIEQSELLAETYSKWEHLGVRGPWKHYRLITNTGTKIEIVADGFEFENAGDWV